MARNFASKVFPLLGGLVLATAARAEVVRVSVQVPDGTPSDASVYLAGSTPALGGWKADGVKLQRQADGTYAAEVTLDPGPIEYKFTRGTWDTVEQPAAGGDRPNRRFTVAPNALRLDATVERWATPAGKASTVVGTLKLIEIDSAALGAKRTVRVWLPPGYDADPVQRPDVLYLHDGQNCFDAATSFSGEWRVDETLTTLIEAKAIRPILIVGLDNGGTRRTDEYTYGRHPRHGGGAAAKHAAFLVEEVMPRIAKDFRIRTGPEHTLIGGSSLGGLVSLEIARRHPGVFGGVMAMSPSLWWLEPSLLDELDKSEKAYEGVRVWADMGTRETGDEQENAAFVAHARRLDALLTAKNVRHRLVLDDGAAHNEAAWAKRFPDAIKYLLSKD